ncbi:chondroitin sulfate synthase 3-like isoform X2 [Clavelina lepadiformis]
MLLDSNCDGERSSQTTTHSHARIFVGMMSMDKYLNSRVKAAVDTWMKRAEITVAVFANNNGTLNSRNERVTILENGVPVIQLAGVTDYVYPPQKKSFAMLNYLYAEHINDYDWFVRLDDDAFVNGEYLNLLLNSINSSKPFYLGGVGFGKHQEDYMEYDENYCMGGPGMVFSRGLLRKIGPKLSDCLLNLLTEHEDLELGRCVFKLGGVKCATNWQMRELFFQNFYKGGYAPNIKHISPHKIDTGVIFHANKEPEYQYNFQKLLLQRRIVLKLDYISHRQKEIRRVTWPEKDTENPAVNVNENIRWSALVGDTSFGSSERVLSRGTHSTLKARLAANTMEFIRSMENNRDVPHGKLSSVKHLHSYRTLNGNLSMDIISWFEGSYQPSSTAYADLNYPTRTLNVHQRQYICNSVHFLHEPYEVNVSAVNNRTIERYLWLSLMPSSSIPSKPLRSEDDTTINFVTTLSGRASNFLRFIENFETTFLKRGENVNLFVTLFEQSANSAAFATEIIENLQQKYLELKLQILLLNTTFKFSRGVGLQAASKQINNPNEILFFCDIDLIFRPEILTRIRRNVQQGHRVYYPVFFSQYDPKIVYADKGSPLSHFHFDDISGFWRYFSFGMFAIYKSDFEKTGGFDTSIHGWGLEDLKMVAEVQKAGLDIFQSTEPAQVHIYHDKFCDPKTTPKQFEDCKKSRATHFGSKSFLYFLYKFSSNLANELGHS